MKDFGGTYTFVYDAENRLDYYAAPSMSSAYSYNGMGLRVAETDSGTGERDLINDGTSPGSSLLVDHNISAKTVAHVYTPGLEQRDGLTGALHLFGVDALGSVRAFVNDDGGQAVTDAQGYYGYGITRTRTGSVPTSYVHQNLSLILGSPSKTLPASRNGRSEEFDFLRLRGERLVGAKHHEIPVQNITDRHRQNDYTLIKQAGGSLTALVERWPTARWSG